MAAVAVVVIALTAATPQGRAAVAHILRYAGIELRICDTAPPPVRTTAPMPGERAVAVEELAGLARFEVKTLPALGAPHGATVSDGGRVASMFWDGVRFDQFDGGVDPIFVKRSGPPWPEFVEVGGYQGFWLPGRHPLGYIKRYDGTEVPLRQAGPTLVWQHGELGYRLEGMKSMEEAIRVAESLE
ncbi:hypothetical protein ITP53_54970 [Nonomuraea sp. K274]|uniref:Uncharacterized protein n=1 Tax=Nonomuraea cypriaca TaxID=1187855 RepID=A0A931F439_9ACTN|nr:hypothetical protein [Nonomuraea cypriaca]